MFYGRSRMSIYKSTSLGRVVSTAIVLLATVVSPALGNDSEAGSHWGPWSTMSECSVTCGSGTMKATRVLVPGPNEPPREEFVEYSVFTCTNTNFPECPHDGIWSGWSAWTQCTKGCGGGTRNRERSCIGRTPGGKECEGDEKSEEKCSKDPCPRLPPNFDMSKCGPAKSNFTCASGKMCIPVLQKCDGSVQCHDGTDEMDCPVNVRLGSIRYDLRNNVISVHKGYLPYILTPLVAALFLSNNPRWRLLQL